MTVAGDLAEFLTGTSSADLPPQAVEHAAMLIASSLASAAMGAGLESSAIIRDLSRERGGTREASVWFDPGLKLPASDAARVNAVMSDAAASDDSDLRNIVHARTTLVASALAIAERTGASGEDVLTAIVLGYEATGRIGEAITPASAPAAFMAASSLSLLLRSPPGGCCNSTLRVWRRPSPCRPLRSAG
jgi:2-methylcitrate dehydratase PrpD